MENDPLRNTFGDRDAEHFYRLNIGRWYTLEEQRRAASITKPKKRKRLRDRIKHYVGIREKNLEEAVEASYTPQRNNLQKVCHESLYGTPQDFAKRRRRLEVQYFYISLPITLSGLLGVVYGISCLPDYQKASVPIAASCSAIALGCIYGRILNKKDRALDDSNRSS